MKKKSAARLEREINEAIANRATKKKKTPSKRTTEPRDGLPFRRQVIDQIKRWVEEEGQGPWDDRTYNAVVKRLTKLVSFVQSFFPGTDEEGLDPRSAAALIVLPHRQALALARRAFRGGPGISGDLEAEDLTYNMDWFRPKDAPSLEEIESARIAEWRSRYGIT
jgi:hypothetical protein